MPAPAELAMFPLGIVLMPSVVVPLHIFEPRYRAMATHLLGGAREPEFGVVLIERGSEVGGHDVRAEIGTRARITEAAQLADGRWAILAGGVERIRVLRWLPDDPWPRALVEDFPDAPAAAAGKVPSTEARWQALQPGIRRVLGLATELGLAAIPVTTEFAADPALGTFQGAAAVPMGPLDEQRVLAASGVEERLDLLEAMVAEQAELLEARLRLG